MIRNFTAAEWDALLGAIAEHDLTLEDQADDPSMRAEAVRERAALARARTKARQLAPEEKR